MRLDGVYVGVSDVYMDPFVIFFLFRMWRVGRGGGGGESGALQYYKDLHF